MRKKWLYRLILSYVPIFFAVIFCLMLVFFLTMSQTVKKQSMQAGDAFGEQALHVVDTTLASIDTMASKNLLLNDKVAAYFSGKDEQNSYAYYQATEVLLDFMAPLPMLDSVYLYRKSDGKVLTEHFSADVEQFGDHDFIVRSMNDPKLFLWSGIRSLYLFGGMDQTRSVVSLVKRVPYYSGEQGLIVINVRAGSLQALLSEMDRGGGVRLCMTDKEGLSFAGPDRPCQSPGKPASASGASASRPSAETAALRSDYTGWELHTALPQAGLFTYISAFSYIWFALGLIAVFGGIAAMTYISHRHYRPLEQVLGRINAFSEKQQTLMPRKAGEDEFAFIDKALESLIAQTNQYEKLQAEEIVYRRVHFFKEVMDGSRIVASRDWSGEVEPLGLDGGFEYAVAAIVELDYYAAFTAEYSQRDQSLFNFTVRSVIQEIAEEEGERLWSEWIAPGRLGLLYRSADGAMERHTLLRVKAMAEKAREWVEHHLTFTVTIGIGDAVKEAAELSASYKQAAAALERKVLLGPNAVYAYDLHWAALAEGAGSERLLQELSETAGLFRLGNPAWKPMLEQVFQTMAAGVYTKEDVLGFLRLLTAHIRRELQELPQALQEPSRMEHFAWLQTLPDSFEWLGDMRSQLIPRLEQLDSAMNALRMNREQYNVAAQVKMYIAEHYADPDLSLAQVSDAFDLNQKTLSRIYKEETGEKFVDYLARERVEHAKRLLLESSEPVQTISEKVGYLYPMSFIRVFKKLTGTTPGDFRRQYGQYEGRIE